MPVNLVDNSSAFDVLFSTRKSGFALLHFRADWAIQCIQMSSVMDTLCSEYESNKEDVIFVNIEAEKVPDVSEKYKVNAVPTFVIVSCPSLKQIDRLNGADPNILEQKLKSVVSAGSSLSDGIESSNTQLVSPEKLQSLINHSPVMLFMKGSTDQPGCAACKDIVDILRSTDVDFATFDVLQDPAVSRSLLQHFTQSAFPLLCASGELVGNIDTVRSLHSSKLLKPKLQDAINDKLKRLISQKNVMLFMKGNPDAPRCGFSREIVRILREHRVEFGHFDILTDELVRQSLKNFSNWPTYPQLYSKGELLGGLDIVREMVESNELEEAFQ